jgi:hypothetical protein
MSELRESTKIIFGFDIIRAFFEFTFATIGVEVNAPGYLVWGQNKEQGRKDSVVKIKVAGGSQHPLFHDLTPLPYIT